MSKRSIITICILFMATMPYSVVHAHHSRAMFDDKNPIELAGTVAEWQFTNPHVFIILNVTGENGENTQWTLEGLGPNTVYRQGWNPESLQPGDKIMVTVDPLFTGGRGGSYSNVRWENGVLVDPRVARP